jgi:hypothetical protein
MTDAPLQANGQSADSEQTRDRRRSDAASPAGWFPPAGGEAAPPLRPGTEPARSDETAPTQTVPTRAVPTQASAPETRPAERPATALAPWWWAHTPQIPAAAAESRGPADTIPAPANEVPAPADTVPELADTVLVPVAVVPTPTAAALAAADPAGRSGWQLAHQAWQESGIDWEFPSDEPEELDEPGETDQRYPAEGYLEEGYLEEGYLDLEPAFAAVPLGAPVAAAPRPPRDDRVRMFPTMATTSWTPRDDPAAAFRAGAQPGSPGTDELFRAWQGSVREAATPGRWQALAAPWRNRAWQAAKIGVPAAVIIAVGAGALIMLTGNANDVLASRAGSGGQPGGTAAATRTAGPGSGVTGSGAGGAAGSGRVPPVASAPVVLQGYPGQRGTVSVGSMWSAAGVTVAVGSADGHPAVWRHASSASTASGTSGAAWTLESAGLLGAGPGTLAAVTDGPAGWIAVGSVVVGGATEPTVLISADGVTWQPVAVITELAGPGAQFLGVTAGHGGYVVVGRRMTGGRTFATLWWSADLRTWTEGSNGGLDGRLSASTANAVTATADGFVAVGSHGEFPAIWTSSDGRNWNLRDLSVPPGARGATLHMVVAAATSGSRVVAGGYAATSAGDISIIETSADGGATWHQVVLGSSGLVTALTATGNGFIAAGLSGADARRAVVWTSPDGLAWSAGTPAPTGADEITALDSGGAAGTVTTGTVTTGTVTTGTATTETEVITIPRR